MYKIEYDEDFPGFRLTKNGNWCETYGLVGDCLMLVARLENLEVPKTIHSESHLHAYIIDCGIVVDVGDDW